MRGSAQMKAESRWATAEPVPDSVREIMDVRQAAEYLGISPDSLYKYASENVIPAFRLGNRWRFKRSLLDRWMEEQSSHRTAPPKGVKPRQKKPAGRAR